MRRRVARLSRVLSDCAYDDETCRMVGSLIHAQAGNITEPMMDLPNRGGILMSKFQNCRSKSHSRCSQYASMCQFFWNGSAGTTTDHASSTNVLRSASQSAVMRSRLVARTTDVTSSFSLAGAGP